MGCAIVRVRRVTSCRPRRAPSRLGLDGDPVPGNRAAPSNVYRSSKLLGGGIMNRGFIGALCLSVTFALLAGCGGSQAPIGAPGAMPQTSAAEDQVERDGSWMKPEAKGED